MDKPIRLLALVVVVGIVFAALHARAGVPPLPKGAKLVFQDDFRGARLSNHWQIERGTWEAQGKGKDTSVFGSGDGGTLVCTQPIGANMRIEYTTWSSHPGDRSVWLGFDKAPAGDSYQWRKGYLFQYGSYFSTRNAIQRRGALLAAPLDAPMPVPNRKSHVVVQKQGIALQMFIDGKKVFDIRDRKASGNRRVAGRHFGFYVWGDGMHFSHVKAYSLPGSQPAEPKPRVSRLVDFEKDKVGTAPTAVVPAANGGCTATVVDEPTFVYKPKQGEMVVPDRCIRLHDTVAGDKASAGFRLAFDPIESGQIEVEFLARSYEGRPLEIALVGKGPSPLATVQVDARGEFWASVPGGKPRKLKDTVEHIHRGGEAARLWLQPQRWFTLRLGFDAHRNTFDVALVNLFTGFYIDGISWVTLGEGLPLNAKGQPATGLRVTTLDRAEMLVDNLIVYGPCGDTIGGRHLDLPLRQLLGLGFPLRKDPFTLGVFSLRNLPKGRRWNKTPRKRRKPTPAFVDAGARYSKLMVRQSAVAEAAQHVARMLAHLGDTTKDTAAQIRRARAVVAKAEASFDTLEALYRAFGHAYVDGMNAKRLAATFDPPAKAFGGELTALANELEAIVADLATLRPRVPAPAAGVSLPDRSKHELTWRDGHFRRDGVPDYYFPYHGQRIGRLAPMLGIDLAPYGYAMAGFHAAWARVPKDWIPTHGPESDVWCTGRFGKPRPKPYHKGYGGNVYSGLNFWNDEVLRMMFETGRSRGEGLRTAHGTRIKECKIAAEGHTQPQSGETGFNPSAVKAFRAWLRKKHGTIEGLNAAWGTAHKSFDDIDQGAYTASKPNGLLADFQRFRQDGYWRWIGEFMRGVRTVLPHVPIANDFNTPFGGISPASGYDLTRMFETYDIVGCHSYDIARRWPTYRLLDSLRKAYGTPIGNQEWGLGSRMPRMFDERAYRTHGLTDLFDAVAWGHSLWHVWYGPHPGWSEGFEFIEHRFDGVTLRFSSGCFPVAMARCRRMGRVALEVPTVPEATAILESTASFYNGFGPHVRMGMLSTAKALERERHTYDFLFERALRDGKQSLDATKLVIVPSGLCMPDALQERLLAWVRRGGVLVAIGPVGLFDEYGKPAAALLQAAFPDTKWQPHDHRLSRCTVTGHARGCVLGTYGKSGQVLKARIGAGLVYVFTDKFLPDLATAFTIDGKPHGFVDIVAPHMPRTVRSGKGTYHLVLRRRPGQGQPLWLYLVNPDFDRVVADEVVVDGAFGAVDDVGLPLPFPVPFRLEDGCTRIRLKLQPGEGTLLRLTPAT